jgi:trehalose synthase
MREVHVEALEPARLERLIGHDRAKRFRRTAADARRFLAGREVLNVNSTATGGGVAELLQTLVAYARGVGVDTRWLVIDGAPDFFDVTKRIHNRLYGFAGDGGPLGQGERAAYEEPLRPAADDLVSRLHPGDVVMLHDPQTAGLAHRARSAGAVIVWRCHIGRDSPNAHTEDAWRFLRPYLEDLDAYVFSRAAFIPSWVDPARAHVIPPSIDPFSTKNEELDDATVRSVLQYAGLLGGTADPQELSFVRRDGSRGRLVRRADVLQTGPPPPPDVPLVVQATRWDRMKDMPGVLRGFVQRLDDLGDAHLMLVGPAVHGVADDPEAGPVLDECMRAWAELPHHARGRVHLACLPMRDPDENALITNALQRHAAVITQKSVAEGFGLSVTEAMWKRRPIVASRVGGIADQIVDREQGLLLDDATDLQAFGEAVRLLLADRDLATRLGDAAHRRVFDEYLGDSHLERYASLFANLPGRPPRRAFLSRLRRSARAALHASSLA